MRQECRSRVTAPGRDSLVGPRPTAAVPGCGINADRDVQQRYAGPIDSASIGGTIGYPGLVGAGSESQRRVVVGRVDLKLDRTGVGAVRREAVIRTFALSAIAGMAGRDAVRSLSATTASSTAPRGPLVASPLVRVFGNSDAAGGLVGLGGRARVERGGAPWRDHNLGRLA